MLDEFVAFRTTSPNTTHSQKRKDTLVAWQGHLFNSLPFRLFLVAFENTEGMLNCLDSELEGRADILSDRLTSQNSDKPALLELWTETTGWC
jgi:hypothetical protein